VTQITVTLDDDEGEQLRQLAARRGLTGDDVIRTAIRREIARLRPPEGRRTLRERKQSQAAVLLRLQRHLEEHPLPETRAGKQELALALGIQWRTLYRYLQILERARPLAPDAAPVPG
jgi:hypothetical protein